MNIYRMHFECRCPVDGALISYELEIMSRQMLMTEDIEQACPSEPHFHENLADGFFRKFGGVQLLKARHGRVEIQTIRGE